MPLHEIVPQHAREKLRDGLNLCMYLWLGRCNQLAEVSPQVEGARVRGSKLDWLRFCKSFILSRATMHEDMSISRV
jgi:hypothetical protein